MQQINQEPIIPQITLIPLDAINPDAMARDRSVIDAAALDELVNSIALSGLRLPIEVYESKDGYALLSGYRRHLAFQKLCDRDPSKFNQIPAIVRPASDFCTTFRTMIEENEIRADLSPFERGRIAVIAAQEGAFISVDEAVRGLFIHASRAKRSKIKSFAELFEVLGDVLDFPDHLSERQGLRMVVALRQGADETLRSVLGEKFSGSPAEEWKKIETVLLDFERLDLPALPPRRAPAAPPIGWIGNDTLRLSTGVTLIKSRDSQGFYIRLKGPSVDTQTVESAMTILQELFEKG